MMKKKAAAGRVSKSSHGNHHDLDVGMIEKKLGKKVTARKKCNFEDYTTNARSKGLCAKHGGGTRCNMRLYQAAKRRRVVYWAWGNSQR